MLVESTYPLDVVVDDPIVLEVKAVAALLPVPKAQLSRYLRGSRRPLGLRTKHHVELLKDGISRRAMVRRPLCVTSVLSVPLW